MLADDESTEPGTTEEIVIVSERHCSRTLGGLEATNWLATSEAIRQGCALQSVKFVLRHPEVMLCDLSNPTAPLSYCEPPLIEQVFDRILEMTQRTFPTEGIRRIIGLGLDPEIPLSGPTEQRLTVWRRAILESAYAEFDVTKATPRAGYARGLEKKVSIVQASPAVQALYENFCAAYGQFISPAYWSQASALNLRLIYESHDVWRQVSRLGENKLFIISAGLALGLGYAECTGDLNLFFTEVHRQNDPNMLHKRAGFAGIYPSPPAAGSWVIVDKAYTGGTIQCAAHRLRRIVGPDAKITTVGMFPKSLQAVLSCDYVVYAGRIIRVEDVGHLLEKDQWHRQLLHAGAQ